MMRSYLALGILVVVLPACLPEGDPSQVAEDEEEIIGGERESGYLAAVALASQGSAPFCSGVVIARTMVLTAGHCLDYVNEIGVPLEIILGPVSDGRRVQVRDTFLHPAYSWADVTRYDLAWLRTDRIPDDIPVATFSTSTPVVDSCATTRYRAVGYGVDDTGASGDRRSTSMCLTEDRGGGALGFWPFPGRADHGDSGGPLFREGTLEVTAIISTGNSLRTYGRGVTVDLDLTLRALLAQNAAPGRLADGILPLDDLFACRTRSQGGNGALCARAWLTCRYPGDARCTVYSSTEIDRSSTPIGIGQTHGVFAFAGARAVISTPDPTRPGNPVQWVQLDPAIWRMHPRPADFVPAPPPAATNAHDVLCARDACRVRGGMNTRGTLKILAEVPRCTRMGVFFRDTHPFVRPDIEVDYDGPGTRYVVSWPMADRGNTVQIAQSNEGWTIVPRGAAGAGCPR